MTILSAPVQTHSRDGWEAIGGGANNTIVECHALRSSSSSNQATGAPRPAAGNTGDASAAIAVDLFSYRIVIYVTEQRQQLVRGSVNNSSSNSGVGGGGAAASGSQRNLMSAAALAETKASSVERSDESIHVVAVSNARDEILDDWERIKDGWRATDGVVDVANWADFYQRIIRMAADEQERGDAVVDSVAAINALVDDDIDALVDDGKAAFHPAGGLTSELRGSRGTSGGSGSGAAIGGVSDDAFSTDSFVGASAILAGEGITDIEMWVARTLAAWYWSDIYQSIVLLGLFGHGWWVGWMNAWCGVIIFCLVGFNFPHYARHSAGQSSETAALADRRADLLRRLAFQARGIVGAIFGAEATAMGIRSKMATLIILDFAATIFWGASIVTGLERLICPVVCVTLIAGFVLARVFGVQPPSVPASAAAAVSAGKATAVPSSVTFGSATGATTTAAATAGGGSRASHPAASSAAAVAAAPTGDDALAPCVEAHFDLYNSADWVLVKEKDGVTFVTKSVPWCDKKACKYTMVVPGASAGTLEAIICDDPDGTNKKSAAYTFDRLLTKKAVLQTLHPGKRYSTKIVQTFYKSPVWGVAARDMVSKVNVAVYLTPEEQARFKLIPNAAAAAGRLTFLQSGLDYGTELPETKGFQRGATHRYGFLGQETPEGLRVTLTMSIDPCGKIPASIVELTNAEQIEKMIILRKLLREKGPMPPQSPVPGEGPTAAAGAPPPSVPRAVAASAAAVEKLPQRVESLFELINRGDWTLVKEKDGVKFHAVAVPWCDKKACKFTVFVPGATAATLEAVTCDDPDCTNRSSAVYTFDALLDKKRLIAKHDENNATILNVYKSPVWGIAPRDLCVLVELSRYLTPAQQKHYKVVADGSTGDVFVQSGVDKSDGCPEEKGYQRGKLHYYGFIGRETEGGVEVTLAMSLDPCGRVPASLIEMTNAEQIEKLVKLRKLMQGKGPVVRVRPPEPAAAAAAPVAADGGVVAPVRVLLLGAPRAGRSTLVAMLAKQPSVPPAPHKQQPPVPLTIDSRRVLLNDFRGGADALPAAVANADAIVYMIDAAGALDLQAAKSEIEKVTSLPGRAPMLVLGNKADVNGSLTDEQLNALLPSLLTQANLARAREQRDRPTLLYMSSLVNKTGVAEGLRWLLQSVAQTPTPTPGAATAAAAAAAGAGPKNDLENARLWTTRLLHSQDWKLKLEKDDVTYHEMPSPFVRPEVKVNAVKFSTFVPNVTPRALDVLLNDVERVKLFDRLIDSKTLVRRIDGSSDCVFHSKYKSPVWGVKARDMVTRVTPRLYLSPDEQRELGLEPSDQAGGVVFMHVGRDASTDVPPEKDFQRAEVHCFGFLAQEERSKGGMRITNCFSMDPCGAIPKSIVAASNAEQVEKLRLIRRLLQEMPKADYQQQQQS